MNRKQGQVLRVNAQRDRHEWFLAADDRGRPMVRFTIDGHPAAFYKVITDAPPDGLATKRQWSSPGRTSRDP